MKDNVNTAPTTITSIAINCIITRDQTFIIKLCIAGIVGAIGSITINTPFIISETPERHNGIIPEKNIKYSFFSARAKPIILRIIITIGIIMYSNLVNI